jgi:small subunit ribosomal protein S1
MQEEVERSASVTDPVGSVQSEDPTLEKVEQVEAIPSAPKDEQPAAQLEEPQPEEKPSVSVASADISRTATSIPPAHRPGLVSNNGGEPTTMEALLKEEEYDYRQPERGDVLPGIVMSVGQEGVIVDVGLKREGIVPPNDLERLDKQSRSEIKAGDEIYVYVLRPRDRDGNLLLSIFRARSESDWTNAQEMMEKGEIWEGKISAHNQGGLVVPFGKIRGFLPASQVVGIPRRLTEEAKVAKLAELVNQTLPLKVIEVDRRRRRLIFSHRAAWWKWKDQQRGRLLDNLAEGDVCQGVVSSLRDFGAFVDLGGADGLIHVSELAWRRVKHPNEILKVGDEVEAVVLNVDKDRKRIGLSVKRMHPEPWSLVEERYHINDLVEGVVTRVVDFGAFIRIADGVEGLIHRSELADVIPQRISDLVQEGQLLLLRIIRIDSQRRRIGLSLRQVSEEEWSKWAAAFHSREIAPAAVEPAEPVEQPETVEPAESAMPEEA